MSAGCTRTTLRTPGMRSVVRLRGAESAKEMQVLLIRSSSGLPRGNGNGEPLCQVDEFWTMRRSNSVRSSPTHKLVRFVQQEECRKTQYPRRLSEMSTTSHLGDELSDAVKHVTDLGRATGEKVDEVRHGAADAL